jgi:hypothetical protein
VIAALAAAALALATAVQPVPLALSSPAAVNRPHPKAADVGQFLVGAALGLGLHESGHVIAGAAFGAHPGVTGISFGFIPFFAITHHPVSPAREYTISSAGFWVQSISSEWILARRPGLRREHAPIAKGVLAFDVLASAIYGVAGLAHIGPPERDTRSMAASLRVNESWVGTAVLPAAVLDAWRYMRPEAKLPRWASRASKVGLVLLVVRAAR